MNKIRLGNRTLNCAAKRIVNHARELFDIPTEYAIEIVGAEIDTMANCWGGDDAALIEINSTMKWSPIELSAVVGHEMVHVYQTINNGLELGEDEAYYQGEHYRLKYEAEYWLAPWEIEARGFEDYFRWYWSKSQARNMEKAA